jgi:hypothetical protein
MVRQPPAWLAMDGRMRAAMGTVERFLRVKIRWIGMSRADLLAGIVLLGVCGLWSGLTWGRLYDPIVDQGWQMQAAARVADGQVLYRELIWMYGPLPVYLLALLFRGLGTGVFAFLLLFHVLATLGCLLTYHVARFLLRPALALPGTLALFLGGWWGGFVGYTQAYTGAVPLGAVAGLAFVACLLSYLREGSPLWLVIAGVAAGAALLTKPEFAVACVGTGSLILAGLALFPRGLAGKRGNAVRALGLYTVSTVVVAGVHGLRSRRHPPAGMASLGHTQILAVHRQRAGRVLCGGGRPDRAGSTSGK